ncbi:MAG: YfhO family protein, partial [Crenarchaeota archaeon]|nr:YfhO family protein [Thermoproteota archaeon]
MNKKKSYVFSFLIPAALMMMVFIILKMYPFGEKSILVADMRYQFVDYLAYFKTIFTDKNDFFYTFSKSLGGDMLGLSSYYLQNPFNLLLLLFSDEMLPVGIMMIIVLQSGLSGLC